MVYHLMMVTLLAGILLTLYLALPSVMITEVKSLMASPSHEHQLQLSGL